MEATIYSILSNDADIQSILEDTTWTGTGTEYKIFHQAAPQDKVEPYITYQRITTDPHDTKDGVSTLDVVDVDVDIWATTNADLVSIAAKVRAALDRKEEGTYGGDEIQSIRFTGQNSNYNEATQLHHITQTFSVRQKNP